MEVSRADECVGTFPEGNLPQPAESDGSLSGFELAWREKERQGYQYGEDALRGVRLGWEIATEKIQAIVDLWQACEVSGVEAMTDIALLLRGQPVTTPGSEATEEDDDAMRDTERYALPPPPMLPRSTLEDINRNYLHEVKPIDPEVVRAWKEGTWVTSPAGGVLQAATSEDLDAKCSEAFDEAVRAEMKVIEVTAKNERLEVEVTRY